MLSIAAVLVLNPAQAGKQQPDRKSPESLEALVTLAGFSEAGWVSCPLPKGRSANQIRMSDLSLHVMHDTSMTALVEQPSGVTVVKPRLNIATCQKDPECIETQKVEQALGTYRWAGAEAGVQGTCVFEPATWVKIPGRFELRTPLGSNDKVSIYGCEGVEMQDGSAFEITAIEGLPCSVAASTLTSSEVGHAEVDPVPGALVVVKLGPPPPDTPRKEQRADAALVRALASPDLAPHHREVFQGWKQDRDEASAGREARKKLLKELDAEVSALLKEFE